MRVAPVRTMRTSFHGTSPALRKPSASAKTRCVFGAANGSFFRNALDNCDLRLNRHRLSSRFLVSVLGRCPRPSVLGELARYLPAVKLALAKGSSASTAAGSRIRCAAAGPIARWRQESAPA
jgi:hypothetical protein